MTRHLSYTLLAVLAAMFAACNFPRDIRQAQAVVTEADNLKAAGAEMDDSVRLAEAAWTLDAFPCRLVYADDYAHACYHYGRLLRNRDNQVEAMQWFINGTHSHTKDHLTKRHIYNNIGDMCHLADEFQLSYDMFKKGADELKNTKDSIPYYYTLYRMAFEKAEMKQTEQTLSLIGTIRQNCADYDVITYTWLPLGALYLNTKQYDSALYAANQLQQRGNKDAISYTFKAHSLWGLEQYDSAVYYARELMSLPSASENDRYNMLYILAYNDSTISNDSIKALTEERADIDREILDPRRHDLTIAVDLLLNDIKHQNQRFYFILLVVIISMSASLYFLFIGYIRWESKREIAIERKHLEIKTKREQTEQKKLRKEQIEIKAANAELLQQSVRLQQQYSGYKDWILLEIEHNSKIIRESPDWKQIIYWKDFDKMTTFVNLQFFLLADKLKSDYKLKERDIRLCTLVLVDICDSLNQMAEILNYSKSGIGTYKYRISKKLHTDSDNLRNSLLQIAVSGQLSNHE